MFRTLGSSPVHDPDESLISPDDYGQYCGGQPRKPSDGQRITQRFRFQVGTWELDGRKGTDSVLGFEYTPDLAAAVLSGAIRDEGADEVTGPPVSGD